MATFQKEKIECLGVEGDGSQTLRVTGTGRNITDAKEQAKKDAVMAVIFDGIRDIVSDINDYAEAQRVIGILLSIASDKRTCIVCVLHQNKAIEDKTSPRCSRHRTTEQIFRNLRVLQR